MDYFLPNSNSECSSGCESGWTLYLENSFISPYQKENDSFLGEKYDGFSDGKAEEEEEDDLSMISDASSGPPHFHQELEDYTNESNNRCFYNAPVDATLCRNSGKKKKKQKLKENRHRKVHEKEQSLLDDTASSPVFNLPNNNFALTNNHASEETGLDFSQGYSRTHFEGSSMYQDQYGFFQSSLSGNYPQENQWFGGRRWQQ
ncbi:hypothetical protein ACH5RR_002153 [Cinchona calisaya]|uniref:Uncharacterized protein n=1 Tax=Cinchona calisaya TaxID=153742 RepID=A0ABD3B5F2_9GENT